MGDTPLAQTLEPLQPLLACATLYLLFLVALWWVVRPRLIAIRKKRTLPRQLGRLTKFLLQLGLFALLLLGALWSLVVLGVVGDLTAAFNALIRASRAIPPLLWLLIILVLAAILGLMMYPGLARASTRKK